VDYQVYRSHVNNVPLRNWNLLFGYVFVVVVVEVVLVVGYVLVESCCVMLVD
jgi:dolichyl-phosphate-mannose--protein O-mannosyl transferase